jgi:hypothetical protein
MIAEYDFSGITPTLSTIASKLKKLNFTTDILGT